MCDKKLPIPSMVQLKVFHLEKKKREKRKIDRDAQQLWEREREEKKKKKKRALGFEEHCDWSGRKIRKASFVPSERDRKEGGYLEVFVRIKIVLGIKSERKEREEWREGEEGEGEEEERKEENCNRA